MSSHKKSGEHVSTFRMEKVPDSRATRSASRVGEDVDDMGDTLLVMGAIAHPHCAYSDPSCVWGATACIVCIVGTWYVRNHPNASDGTGFVCLILGIPDELVILSAANQNGSCHVAGDLATPPACYFVTVLP
jgi:hypothetical protein